MIDKAFILAAGFGKRLRPYTDHTPKPLVEVAGRTLLERTLDHLLSVGVTEATINLHYLGAQIEERLKDREEMQLVFSHESELLDTGGGIKKAISNFKGDDFYVLSGDGFWTEGPNNPALKRLKENWDPVRMDILILLQPVSTMILTEGVGDYDLNEKGCATRSRDQSGQYMFTSIRINKASIFDDTPDGPFSYLELLDRAEAAGRLFGLVHEGDWHHISTPADLDRVNETVLSLSEDA